MCWLFLFRILARAASFAILIGSGIEPWRVKELMIVDTSAVNLSVYHLLVMIIDK